MKQQLFTTEGLLQAFRAYWHLELDGGDRLLANPDRRQLFLKALKIFHSRLLIIITVPHSNALTVFERAW